MPIPLADCNLVVASVEVNATIAVSFKQVVQQVLNSGGWILVILCLLAQSSRIYAHPTGSILSTSKKDRGPIKRDARPDPDLSEPLIQLFSHLTKFYK